jgi:hypothetical protein
VNGYARSMRRGVVVVIAALLACARAPGPTPVASGSLRTVRILSATAGSSGAIHEITIEVETGVTGGPLVGSTPCRSIFDGTSLVLYDAGGGEVFRQAHDVYCSPYDRGHPVALPDGVARTTLHFPLDGPVAWAGTTAELKGTLAGRDDVPIASSAAAVVAR